jgi:hypothetical protein
VLVSPIDVVTVSVNTARTEIDLFAAFQDADHTDRELLFSVTSNTNPSLLATVIDPATGKLIINFAANATGSSQLTVRASDPQRFFAEDTFNVTRTLQNNPPVLAHIGDATLNHVGTTAIQVEASDPDGHALSFDVAVESEAYLINQQFKLETHVTSFDNWGGRDEKWIRSRDFQWFFLLPNGELREWDRSGNATGNLIANVGSYFYNNPLALAEAKAGAVGLGTFTLESIGATKSRLLMSSAGAFNGRFQVTVTVTDSLGASDMETFTASR